MSPTSSQFTLRKELKSNLESVFGNLRWLLHLGIWMLLCLFVLLTEEETFGKVPSWSFFLVLIGAAGFNYTIILWITPFNRYKNNTWILAGSTLINLIFWWALLFFTRVKYYSYNPDAMPQLFQQQKGMILGFTVGHLLILGWAFFACYYFVDLYNQQKILNRYQAVLTDKLNAELAFLKTQINPHFLFNTLNSIYSLTLKGDNKAADIAYRLRDLLHYMLYDCAKEKVPVTSEVAFLKNYISLEEQRNKKENVTITFEAAGEFDGKEIAPLLLINFLENAFKHGVKSGIGHATITARLTILANELIFNVHNTKQVVQEAHGQPIKASGGIGLANVKDRLNIIYPTRHRLAIKETDTSYDIHLSLMLH